MQSRFFLKFLQYFIQRDEFVTPCINIDYLPTYLPTYPKEEIADPN